MNPPNNIQNGFFTPVSPFFSKIRKLTVFSRSPHTPIIPQSVRLRMGRGRVIRAEKPPFVPLSRRPACSPRPFRPEFSGNKKNHMPGARGACRAYDGGIWFNLSPANSFHRCANSFHRCGGPPPSRREVWGFASSRSLLYNSGCRVETLLVSKGVMGFLGDLRGRNRNLPLIP